MKIYPSKFKDGAIIPQDILTPAGCALPSRSSRGYLQPFFPLKVLSGSSPPASPDPSFCCWLKAVSGIWPQTSCVSVCVLLSRPWQILHCQVS